MLPDRKTPFWSLISPLSATLRHLLHLYQCLLLSMFRYHNRGFSKWLIWQIKVIGSDKYLLEFFTCSDLVQCFANRLQRHSDMLAHSSDGSHLGISMPRGFQSRTTAIHLLSYLRATCVTRCYFNVDIYSPILYIKITFCSQKPSCPRVSHTFLDLWNRIPGDSRKMILLQTLQVVVTVDLSFKNFIF